MKISYINFIRKLCFEKLVSLQYLYSKYINNISLLTLNKHALQKKQRFKSLVTVTAVKIF